MGTVQFKIPDKSELVDQQFFQIPGPDQTILTGFQFDAETCSLYRKESQVLIPSFHGFTHVAEDPVPLATTDSQGHLGADDKAKLDALIQTRIGILGFQGSGFPDDGGFLQGDIILAAGSEFISLERIGSTVRFTVDVPNFINCNCEECASIFWLVDESEPEAIRPPSCNGKMPGVNAYGELKVFLLPESAILDPANPIALLNTKGNFPTFIFKRYDDGITALEAEIDIVLKRNSNLTTQTGWAMTPGPTGITETVWFTGLDSDGGQIRFELKPESEPGLLGAVLYKGHTITRRMAVITSFESTVLSTNQYRVRFWDIQLAEPIGSEFTATNIWKFQNPENSPTDPANPRKLTLDATKSLLEVGTLVQLWEFDIGEVAGSTIFRRFFNKEPDLPASAIWALVAAVSFGDLVSQLEEVTAAGTLLTADDITTNGVRLFEKTIWGITTFEDRLILSDDGEVVEVTAGIYEPSGTPINNLFVADIDSSIPGLRVSEIPQTLEGDINGDGVVDEADLDIFCAAFGTSTGDPGFNADADFNSDGTVDVRDLAVIGRHFDVSIGESIHERPVFLWHRGNHKNVLLSALIGMPDGPNSQDFPPYDILLRAPIDSFDDTYMKVVRRGTYTTGAFIGAPFIVVKGVHWENLPQSGVLRILSGAFRNTIWRYAFKAAFSPFDDDGVTLIGIDEVFPFDEDFPCGTGFVASDPNVPTNTTVAELLHVDYTAPVARLEFSVNETATSEAVQLQIKVGTLDMTLPYELNRGSTVEDDLVRGLRPGFAVSSILTQDGIISDGIGAGIESDPEGFRVFEGGELPVPVNGETERWNKIEIMLRDDQVWIWWNNLIIPPDSDLSVALPTPVIVNTPFFPLTTELDIGKVGFRMWPGAVIRSVELRNQSLAFNEFTRGQLEIVS